MLIILSISLVAFLLYDWSAGRLGNARVRIKIVYALLLLLSGYHLLIIQRVIAAHSFYDMVTQIFGEAAERLLAYLDPKG